MLAGSFVCVGVCVCVWMWVCLCAGGGDRYLAFDDMLDVFFIITFSGYALGETASMSADQVGGGCYNLFA